MSDDRKRRAIIVLNESVDWCDGCKFYAGIKPTEFPCNICSALKTNQYEKGTESEKKHIALRISPTHIKEGTESE